MSASQQGRPDVVAERAAFAHTQATLPPEHLVFVDESGVEMGMRCRYGYARRGQRCAEHAPFRVGRRTSLIGCFGLRGGVVAPLAGTVDSGVFARFVRHVLVPHLVPGDVVVWDNARIHSAAAVRQVEAAGARVLAQPRYSPETNASEQAWSKIKAAVRRRRADTPEALVDALEAAVASLRSSDVQGWMKQCGYDTQSE